MVSNFDFFLHTFINVCSDWNMEYAVSHILLFFQCVGINSPIEGKNHQLNYSKVEVIQLKILYSTYFFALIVLNLPQKLKFLKQKKAIINRFEIVMFSLHIFFKF